MPPVEQIIVKIGEPIYAVKNDVNQRQP